MGFRQGNRRKAASGSLFNRRSLALAVCQLLESRKMLSAVDPAYGDSGSVVFDVASASSDAGYDVAVQADGKTVSVGGSGTDFVVVRRDTSGSLDTTFGTNGVKTIDFGGTDVAHGVGILPDGRIFVVGETSGDFALCMLSSSGTLDTTFSGDGLQTKNLGGTDTLWGTTYDPVSDRIFAVGMGDPSNYSIVARYKLDGTLDTSWDSDGLKYQSFGSNQVTYALQLDGKIVIAGKMGGDFIVVRYNTNGSNDTSFDSDGRQIINLGSTDDVAYGLAIKGTGSSERILLAGSTGTGSATTFALVQIDGSNGSLDSSFGTSGKVTTSFGSSASAAAYDAVYLPTGEIAVGGTANGDAVVALYTATGSLNTLYNGTGTESIDWGTSTDAIRSLALTTSNKAIGFGSSGSDLAIVQTFISPLASPTGAAATATADGGIQITWTDNSSSEDVFVVERATSSSGPWTELTTVSTDETSIVDNVGEGQSYYYRVYASNDFARSTATSSVSATFVAFAVPGNFNASPAAKSVSLNWTDTSASETSVVLERATNSAFSTNLISLATLDADTTDFSDDTVTEAGSYYYRIRYQTSSASTSWAATSVVDTGIIAPLNLSLSSSGADGDVTLTWSDESSAETGYVVERAAESDFVTDLTTVATLSANSSTYTDVALTSGSYYYRVSAIKSSGPSSDYAVETIDHGIGSRPALSASLIGTVRAGSGTSGSPWKIYRGQGINLTLVQPTSANTTNTGTLPFTGTEATKSKVTWDFGDTTSGSSYNVLPGYNAGHVYHTTGTYTVVLSVVYPGSSTATTVTKTVLVESLPTANKIYVQSGGNTGKSGTSLANAVSFKEGIAKLATLGSGTTVFFKAGTTITQANATDAFNLASLSDVTFVSCDSSGNEGGRAILQLNSDAGETTSLFSFSSTSNRITFRNFTVRGASTYADGYAFNPFGAGHTIDGVNIEKFWQGVHTNANADTNFAVVAEGLIVTKVNATYSSTTDDPMVRPGEYGVFLSKNTRGVSLLGNIFGNTAIRNHNTRMFSSQTLVYDNRLTNYKNDATSGQGPHINTLRANGGKFLWWAKNVTVGGQIYIGKYLEKGSPTPKGFPIQYVIVEQNIAKIATSSENSLSTAVDVARLEINKYGGSTSDLSYVMVRNNLIDSSAGEALEVAVFDNANISFLHNSFRVRPSSEIGKNPWRALLFTRKLSANGYGASELKGNLVAGAVAGGSMPLAVEFNNTSSLANVWPIFKTSSSSSVARGFNAFSVGNYFGIYGGGTVRKSMTDWNFQPGDDDNDYSSLSVSTAGVPTASASLAIVPVLQGVWDDLNGSARPTSGSRDAGADEI